MFLTRILSQGANNSGTDVQKVVKRSFGGTIRTPGYWGRELTAEPLTALQVYMDPNEMFVCDVGDERGSGSDPRFCLHAGKVLRGLRF